MSNNTADHSDAVVYPEQVTADFLYELFRDAYFNVHRDEVGDVYVKENYSLWVFPQQEGEQVRLMAQFRASAEVLREVKLEYANGVNDGLKLIRAYVDEDNAIGFDYYISVEGGITKRNLALSVRRFADYVRTALQRDDQGIFG